MSEKSRKPRVADYLFFAAPFAGTLATLGLEFYLDKNNLFPQSLPIHVVSGGIFLASAVLDHASTRSGFREKDAAKTRGVRFKHGGETNLLMWNVDTLEDFDHSPVPYVLPVVGTILATLIPEVGFPLTTAKSFAAINNFRQARIINKLGR